MPGIPTWQEIEASKEYKSLTDEEKKKVRVQWESDMQKESIKLLPTVEEFKTITGLPTWREIVASDEYQSLTHEQKEKLKQKYAQDSGFDPENQVFKSDGNILTELIKGVTQSSATAEMFSPTEESIPEDAAGRIARSVGSVVGDLPLFVAGSFGGTLGSTMIGQPQLAPYIGAASAFATPSIIKSIYRAKNVGALSRIPFKVTAQQLPGDVFMHAMSPYGGVVPTIEQAGTDEEVRKFKQLVKEGATEAGISALTGVALTGASRFISGVAKSNRVVDAVLQKAQTETSSQNVSKLIDLAKSAEKINPEAIYARKITDKAINAIQQGQYEFAKSLINRAGKLQSKMKVVEHVAVPTTVLTTVPAALHGEMPTGEDVATALTITAAMPAATKLGTKVARGVLGIKPQESNAFKSLEQYKQALETEEARIQKTKISPTARMKDIPPAKVYDMFMESNPKLARAYEIKIINEMRKPIAQEREALEKQYTAAKYELAAKLGLLDENGRITVKDFVSKEKYDKMPAAMKEQYAVMDEKMMVLKQALDKVKSKWNNMRRMTDEKKALVGDAIKNDILNTEAKFMYPTLKAAWVRDYKNMFEAYEFYGKTYEEIVSRLEQMTTAEKNTLPKSIAKSITKKGITPIMKKRLAQFMASMQEIPKTVAENTPEQLKSMHTLGSVLVSRNAHTGEETVKREIPVFFKTEGANILLSGQNVYLDAKTAHKYEPHGILKAAKVKARDLMHTGIDNVLMYQESAKSERELYKRGTQPYKLNEFCPESAEKMDMYVETMKEFGLKTETFEDVILSVNNQKIVEINLGSKHEQLVGKTDKTLRAFGNEVLHCEKSGSNPTQVAPITAGFFSSLLNALRTVKYDTEFLLHGKLKQGVYFYEEMGAFGQMLRRALTEQETNGMRLAKELHRKYDSMFDGISKERRELLTYVITVRDPQYLEFYQKVGYINKFDPNYDYAMRGTPELLLNHNERIAKERIETFYKQMLEYINLARESVGRDPIKPKGEDTYSPLSQKNVGIAHMVLNMLSQGEDVIGKSADEIAQHIENQIKNYSRKAGNVTFHNLKLKKFAVDTPEMDAKALYFKYVQDSSRYISLQPITVYVADALCLTEINGIPFRYEGEGPSVINARNRLMEDLGFLQMGHRFVEKQANTREWNKIRTFLAKMQNNIAAALILYNTNVVVNQIAAFRNTLAKFGPEFTFKIAMNIGSVANIKETRKLINESEILYARWNEPFRELYEGIGHIKKYAQDAGIFFSKIVDLAIATGTYKTAKQEYLKENPGDVRGAILYADNVIAKTQASTLMTDRAPIQRGIFGIYVTTFANAPLADYGFLVHDVLGYHRNMDKKDIAFALANYIVATAIVNTIYEELFGMESVYPAPLSRYMDLKNKGYDDKYISYAVTTEMLKMYPLGQGSRMGGSALGPIVTHVDTILKGSADPRYFDKALFSAAISLMYLPGAAQLRRIHKAEEPAEYFITTKEQTRQR